MDDEIDKSVLDTIKKSQDLPRKHADFFNWGNKETKERSICYKFTQYLFDTNGEVFDLVSLGGDPPDCIAKTKNTEVGIEVVELVDQKAIEDRIRLKKHWVHQQAWTTEKLMENLNKLIQGKDSPKKKVELLRKYERYIALIHTDEPELTAQDFDALFSSNHIKSTDLVTEAYILFSYDPQTRNYPIRRVL